MTFTRLIPLVFALCLSACVSSSPRMSDFGETVTLGPDCHELAGTYSNLVTFTTSEHVDQETKHTLEMLFEDMNDPDVNLSNPEYVTISFPEKGMLKIDKFNPEGEVLGSRTLLESKGEFACSNGELTTHTQSATGVSGAALGLWAVANSSESRSFTITTKKYLQAKVSQSGTGALVWVIVPVPIASKSSDWYYFKPMAAGQLQPQHGQSEAEGPLIFITTMSDIEAGTLEKVATAAFASHRYTFDNLKAEQADFTVAIQMEIKYGEYKTARGYMQLMTLGLVNPCTPTEFNLTAQVLGRSGSEIRSYKHSESENMGRGEYMCRPSHDDMQKKKTELLMTLFHQIIGDKIFTYPGGVAY